MEQFEQLLTCCVCLDRYRIPKLLPCQHSFCMEPCMEGLVDYVRRQVRLFVTCTQKPINHNHSRMHKPSVCVCRCVSKAILLNAAYLFSDYVTCQKLLNKSLGESRQRTRNRIAANENNIFCVQKANSTLWK